MLKYRVNGEKERKMVGTCLLFAAGLRLIFWMLGLWKIGRASEVLLLFSADLDSQWYHMKGWLYWNLHQVAGAPG